MHFLSSILSARGVKALILACSALALAAVYFAPARPGDALHFRHETSAALSALSRDNTTYEELKKARTSAALSSLVLRFNDYDLLYDREQRTYFYSLIGESRSSFNPAVTMENSGPEFAIAFRESPITPESVRNNTKHAFIIYNDAHYAEFYFTVTTLPVMHLESNHPEHSPGSFITGKKSAVRMTLFDNRQHANHLQRVVRSEAGVRTRGASSLHYSQKSYRLSLSYISLGHNKRKNPVSLLDMRADKDWILYAPFNDPDKVRNVFSNNLWWEWGAANNSFGIKNGSQCRFVELFINGQYQGIYGLMQPIDGPQLGIVRTNDPKTTEYQYRKVHNKPALEQNFSRKFYRAASGGFEVRSPKNMGATYEKWAPLAEYLKVLGGPDDVYGTRYPEITELGNLIDIWLYVSTALGGDNQSKNLCYVAKWNGERHVFIFAPWDLDQTWGLGWTGKMPWLTAVIIPPDAGLLYHPELPGSRAITQNFFDIRSKVKQRYAELRQTVLSDASLSRQLDHYEADIFGSGAMLRNREKWPIAAYAEDMTAFREFVFRRIAFMDKAIAGL